MAASNRAKLITKLHSELKKRYDVRPAQPSRPLLEHLLYACLLEDCPHDLADEGMAKCEPYFFDWNEVRVTTVTELAQVLNNFPDPTKSAKRLKDNLQSVFEEFYTFDIDQLKKENLGKAVTKFEAMPSMTPFVLSYTIQHGLGGHSIPIDYSAMVVMLSTGIVSQSEANAGKVPGLERAIPKNKGIEFSDLLHTASVALKLDPKDKKARQLLDAVSKGSSDRLDAWFASKKAAIRRVRKRRREEAAAAKEAAEKAAAEKAAAEAAKAEKAAKKAARAAKAAEQAKQTASEQAAATKAAAEKAAAKSKTTAKAKSSTKTASKTAAAKKAAASKSTMSTKTAGAAAKKTAGAAAKKTAKKPAAKTTKKATKKTTASKSTAKKASGSKSTAKKATKKTAKKKPTTKKAKKKASSKPATKKATKKKASKKSSSRKLSKRKPR